MTAPLLSGARFIGQRLLRKEDLRLLTGRGTYAGVAWRAVREEDTLRAELTGYEAYAARVRYRFVPHVW